MGSKNQASTEPPRCTCAADGRWVGPCAVHGDTPPAGQQDRRTAPRQPKPATATKAAKPKPRAAAAPKKKAAVKKSVRKTAGKKR